MSRPSDRVVVFDAMGTLFDLSALDPVFERLGAAAELREAWFERVLDTTKALTILGEFAPFRDVAISTLRSVLAAHELDPDAAENIVDALAEVPAYPDARPALDRLAEADVPAVVLTNGGAKQTKQLLERAGLDDRISRVFTTEEVKAYKPDPRPYRRVCEQLDIESSQAVLVATHGWDVAGALAAGYDAVWVDRLERCWPLPTDEPARRARDLVEAVSATG